MRLWSSIAVALLGLLAAGTPARADYTYQFADSSGNAANSFNVGVGQTVDIRVYILATSPDTLNGGQNGLAAAGVQLNTATPSIATVTAVTPNAAFDAGSSTATGAHASVSEFSSSTNGVQSGGSGANDRVLLGTFTFTGVSAGQTLTVSALPGLAPDNVKADGTIIDAALLTNTQTAVITVAVPEPGTLMLTGLFAVGLATASVRRLRRPTIG